MTLIRIDLRHLTPDERGTAGHLTWQPWTRRAVDQHEVLPEGFHVALSGGVAELEVPAGHYAVREYVAGGYDRQRLLLVPDAAEVAYVDLAEVDPSTLEPSAEPEAAWWAALEAGTYGVTATIDPNDADVLLIRFPVWRYWPADTNSVAIPVLTGA